MRYPLTNESSNIERHTPVFVLTHHPRATVRMAGGTEFHFVTDGIEAALAQAQDAAGGRDVRVVGGGVDMRALGYECAKSVAGERATHVFLRKPA